MKSLYKVNLQNNYILVLLVFQTNEEEEKKTMKTWSAVKSKLDLN